MQLIMESWRAHTYDGDFSLIVEKYNKKLITETQYINIWEKRMLTEGNELFTEGLMDILQQGFEAGKELAGDLKAQFDSAAERVVGWFKEKIAQLKPMIENVGENVEKATDALMSLYNAVSAWCKAHKVLCFVAKAIIIMITWQLVLGALAAAGSAVGTAAAGVVMPSGKAMTATQFKVLYGALHSQMVNGSAAMQPVMVKALGALKHAYTATEMIPIAQLPDIVGVMNGKIMALVKTQPEAAKIVLNKMLEAYYAAGFGDAGIGLVVP